MNILIISVLIAVGLSATVQVSAAAVACVYQRDEAGNQIVCNANKTCFFPFDECRYNGADSGYCCFRCPSLIGLARSPSIRTCIPGRGDCGLSETCYYPYPEVNNLRPGACCSIRLPPPQLATAQASVAVATAVSAAAGACVYRRDEAGNQIVCNANTTCPSLTDECRYNSADSGYCCLRCSGLAVLASRSSPWIECFPGRGDCGPSETCYYPYPEVNSLRPGVCCSSPPPPTPQLASVAVAAGQCVFRKDLGGNRIACNVDTPCLSPSDYCREYCCLGCSEGPEAPDLGLTRAMPSIPCFPYLGNCSSVETCNYPYDEVNKNQPGVCCIVQ